MVTRRGTFLRAVFDGAVFDCGGSGAPLDYVRIVSGTRNSTAKTQRGSTRSKGE